MPPQPLESVQNATANEGGFTNEAARGGTISLAMLIDFIIQRTYHELTVLAELYVLLEYSIGKFGPLTYFTFHCRLPRKTDLERKIEIYNFSARTRQLFIRLLALVKWANSASKVDKSSVSANQMPHNRLESVRNEVFTILMQTISFPIAAYYELFGQAIDALCRYS